MQGYDEFPRSSPRINSRKTSNSNYPRPKLISVHNESFIEQGRLNNTNSRNRSRLGDLSVERIRGANQVDLTSSNASSVFFLALANFKMAFRRMFENNNNISPKVSRQCSRDRKMNGSFQSTTTTTSGISSSHGIISAQNSFLETGSSCSLISSDNNSTMSNLSIDERQIQGNINYYRNHKLRNLERDSTLRRKPVDNFELHAISNETLKSVKNNDLNNFFPRIEKEILDYALNKNPRFAVDLWEKRNRQKSMRNSIISQSPDDLFKEKKRPPRLKSLKGINTKSTDTDYYHKGKEVHLVISSAVNIPNLFNHCCLNSEKLTQTIEIIDVNDNITPVVTMSLPMKFEFNIPFMDIKFDKKIKSGFKKNIYRGSWHGDVIVHEYLDLSKSQINRFWTEVEAMTFISHENIALFMGASMEPPYFAVVMSLINGPSLYECLHLIQKRFSSHERLDIIRPILQAISYLHAKGKIIKRLNSRNIYLNPRVTLSLLDFSETYYELELSYRSNNGSVFDPEALADRVQVIAYFNSAGILSTYDAGKSEYVHIPNEQTYYTAPEIFETILSSFVKETYPYISDSNYLLSPMSIVSNFSYLSLNQPPKQVASPLFMFDDQRTTTSRIPSPKSSSQNMNALLLDDESFEEIGSSSNESPPESNLSNCQSRRSSMSSQENLRSGRSLDPNTIDFYKFFQSKYPKVIEEKNLNKETDIFALGTIIYELCANQYPFGSYPVAQFVLKVCSKERQSTGDLRVNSKIKHFIELCWSHHPDKRPMAEVLSRELLSIQSSIKKRSTSEPEDLNLIHQSYDFDF